MRLSALDLALMRATTDVEAPCGCIYRYHWLDKRWFNAGIGPVNGTHDHQFMKQLQSVDPNRVSAGHCMARKP